VAGEHADVAQPLPHAVGATVLHEVALQALVVDAVGDRERVAGLARDLDHALAHVGAEQLYLAVEAALGEVLVDDHRQRVQLLSGRTARHPDPDRVLVRVVDELGEDLVFEGLEDLRVAEELGDVDQALVVQAPDLVGVLLQAIDVVGDADRPRGDHAPTDAADQRRAPVA
jgi:hypothetical protein